MGSLIKFFIVVLMIWLFGKRSIFCFKKSFCKDTTGDSTCQGQFRIRSFLGKKWSKTGKKREGSFVIFDEF